MVKISISQQRSLRSYTSPSEGDDERKVVEQRIKEIHAFSLFSFIKLPRK